MDSNDLCAVQILESTSTATPTQKVRLGSTPGNKVAEISTLMLLSVADWLAFLKAIYK